MHYQRSAAEDECMKERSRREKKNMDNIQVHGMAAVNNNKRLVVRDYMNSRAAAEIPVVVYNFLPLKSTI